MPRREIEVSEHIRQSIGISIKARRGLSEGHLGKLQASHERWTKRNHPSTRAQVQDRGPAMHSCRSHAPYVYFSLSPSRLPSVKLSFIHDRASHHARTAWGGYSSTAILAIPTAQLDRCTSRSIRLRPNYITGLRILHTRQDDGLARLDEDPISLGVLKHIATCRQHTIFAATNPSNPGWTPQAAPGLLA